MKPLTRLCVWFLLSIVLSPCVAAQGYTTEKHPYQGLDFPRPRDYEAIPTQPNETWVALYYAQESKAGSASNRYGASNKPTIRILLLNEKVEGEPEPEPGRTTSKIGPTSPFGRFMVERLKGYVIESEEDLDKTRSGYKATEYRLEFEPGGKGNRRTSGNPYWALEWRGPERSVIVLGSARAEVLDEEAKSWRKAAMGMKLYEPDLSGLEKLRRQYVKKGLKDPDFRVRVRSQIVDGWKFEDLDDYIVVYSTPDQPLMRKICRDIEALRAAYEQRFPPVGEVEAISTVRICKDKSEYHRYGGPPSSAGYWNYVTEELVLYDAAVRGKGASRGEVNTFIALYHEAFHQYIFYSAGQLPPHSWFNEGYGDYFSGAAVSGGKVKKIGPNPWRTAYIQRVIEDRKFVPWEAILSYEKSAYYKKAAICYAQGWSMIYFLNHCEEAQEREEWATILPTYFEVLKMEYKEALAEATASLSEEETEVSAEAKEQAGIVAREAALDQAFAGLDIIEIQDAWREFTLGIKLK